MSLPSSWMRILRMTQLVDARLVMYAWIGNSSKHIDTNWSSKGNAMCILIPQLELHDVERKHFVVDNMT